MDKNLTAKERILMFLENQQISKVAFFESVGIAPSNFKGNNIKSKIGSDALVKILTIYPNLSADWLLTGVGSMLRDTSKPTITTQSHKRISTDRDTAGVLGVVTDAIVKTPEAIPLVSETAVGGFANEHFSIRDSDVLAYYIVPKFRHLGVDFMIELVGDSMIPRLFPGDIIACSIIHNPKFIQWNKPHLIATREQGLIVKRLRKSSDDNCLLAVSDNADYDPFDLPKDEILGLARIVGVIHLE